jgi:hypothetical protein
MHSQQGLLLMGCVGLSAESQEDFKHIDKMSDESVSEFLRAKHMSNSHTRPTD